MSREKELENLLEWVFDQAREGLDEDVGPSVYETMRRDFVFHMLDWGDDLKSWNELSENPGSLQREEALTFMIGFLYHVIPHLNAAGRLLLDDVGNPFADDEVFDALDRTAFWGVVEDCLVRFHGRTRPSARAETKKQRGRVAGKSPEAAGRKEPFFVACEWAGLSDVDQQDRLLSLHAGIYQSICVFRGWRPACFAGR